MTRIGTWVRRAALLGLAAAGLTWGSLPAAEAAGLGSTRLTVDFRKAKEAAQQARWDHMDIIRCAPAG
ncbi:MAG: hypothetical protein QNJ90_02510, partial [Planctomycetota bacterium]|nr:hypothetical protein [Planctomycetota bacterium]